MLQGFRSGDEAEWRLAQSFKYFRSVQVPTQIFLPYTERVELSMYVDTQHTFIAILIMHHS